MPTGASDLLNRLTTQSSACPSAKFALVGYSQGARVVRQTLAKLPSTLYPRIIAIATYGDPGERSTDQASRPAPALPEELAGKWKGNCVKGDPACDKAAGSDFGPHLMYNKEGAKFHGDSAAFVVAGFKGEKLPVVKNEPVPV
jgi:cutinase